MTEQDPGCECAICALELDFELDSHLLEEIENGRCVLFAGAGVSTETSGAHSFSFYDQLANLVKSEGDETFPELVDIFENRPNGRQKLIEEIRSRFDYIDGFRELREAAIKFHKSVATAPYFSTIITTNWDRYFEDVIKATPFVYDSDLTFWENANRPLIKIHGSIDNLSTIVASSADYAQCEKRLRDGRLGDILKHIFATKTVIFFGYSASDSDFLSIYKSVYSSMGQFVWAHYLVSPFLSLKQVEKLKKEMNIIGVKTDASHFVETIKEHMRQKFFYTHDDVYDLIEMKLTLLSQVHVDFVGSYSVENDPHLIFATSYQDGLIHCLQRIVDRRHTNDFANLYRVRSLASLYQDKVDTYVRKRDYWSSSYFAGYQTGLIYFDILNADKDPKQIVSGELLDLPFFYHPKIGHLDRREYDEEVRPYPEIHKAAYKQSLRFAKKYKGIKNVVVHHTPFG